MRVAGVINRRYLKHRFDLYTCRKRIVILGARRVLFRGPARYTRGFVLNVAAETAVKRWNHLLKRDKVNPHRLPAFRAATVHGLQAAAIQVDARAYLG